MRVGDLFSGIGGFSLAADWMGWETAYFSEVHPYASKVLAARFPQVPNLGDITQVRWADQPYVDILCGGFPCQPHSVAGLKKASQDERDLSAEVIRAIRDVRPRYAVLENVPHLLRSEGGDFFRRFLRSLAEIGYDAEWITLSASDMGAPHKRERLWIVAYPHRESQPLVFDGGSPEGSEAAAPAWAMDAMDTGRSGSRAWAPDVADAGEQGRERWLCRGADQEREGQLGHAGCRRAVREQPRPDGWAVEPAVGRVAHGVPHRVDRLRGLGNAIVPHCAFFLFAHIARHAALTSHE
jgi:DNA (cytosine-5)-methyltransferase 1